MTKVNFATVINHGIDIKETLWTVQYQNQHDDDNSVVEEKFKGVSDSNGYVILISDTTDDINAVSKRLTLDLTYSYSLYRIIRSKNSDDDDVVGLIEILNGDGTVLSKQNVWVFCKKIECPMKLLLDNFVKLRQSEEKRSAI